MRPTLGAALTLALFAASSPGQPPANDPPKTPQVQRWGEADSLAAEKLFKAEREAAAKRGPAELERSDALAARAAKLIGRGLHADAVRLLREARFGLPATESAPGVVRILGAPRLRMNSGVESVALSPDASKVVGGSSDGEVKVWDAGNGRELFSYSGLKGEVWSVAWSGDGKWLLATSGNEPHLIDAATGKLAHKLTGHTGTVRSVAFRPDSKACASSGDDMSLKIWNVETGKLSDKPMPDILFAVNQIAYHPNGKMIALGDQSGRLAVYLTEAREGQRQLALGAGAHAQTPCTGVAWAGDGKSIYSVGGNKKLVQHGAPGSDGENVANTGTRLGREFDLGAVHPEVLAIRLAVTPDGRGLLTAGRDGPVRVWDPSTNRIVRTLPGHAEGTRALAISADGRVVASGGADRRVRVSELSLEDARRVFADQKGYVWAAVASSKGKRLATAGADRKIVLRDPESGKLLKAIEGHSAPVTVLAFSPDESLLASAGGDRTIKIWDAATGDLKKEIAPAHAAPVMALAWTGDGKRLLSGSVDRTAKVWDPLTGQAVKELSAWKTPVVAIAISPDDLHAVFGGADGSLRVVALKDYADLSSVPAHGSGVNAVVFVAKDLVASGGGDPAVKLWKLSETGALSEDGRLTGHNSAVTSLGVSPDGRSMVGGGSDGPVRIWNLQTRAETRSLRGHTDWVGGAQFVAGTTGIVSASVDGTVSFWEAAEEEPIAAAPGHDGRVNGAFPSKDGKTFVSCSDDGSARVWELASGRLLATVSVPGVRLMSACLDVDGIRLYAGGSDRKLRAWDWKANKLLKEVSAEPAAGMLAGEKGGCVVWLFKGGPVEAPWSQFTRFDADLTRQAFVTETQKRAAAVALSPDGLWAALGSPDGSIRVWDIEKSERPLGGDLAAHADGVSDLAFSADKALLVSASATAEVKVYDVAKKESVKTFQAHDKGPTAGPDVFAALALSADGKRLLTASLSGEVKLWDVADAKALRTWKLPLGPTSLSFVPGGKQALAAGGDGAITQLELP